MTPMGRKMIEIIDTGIGGRLDYRIAVKTTRKADLTPACIHFQRRAAETQTPARLHHKFPLLYPDRVPVNTDIWNAPVL